MNLLKKILVFPFKMIGMIIIYTIVFIIALPMFIIKPKMFRIPRRVYKDKDCDC